MLRVFILILITLGTINISKGQQETNHWIFGEGVHITTNGVLSNSTSQSSINTYEGCVTQSDQNGNLLFYSDGNKVWDKNNNVMPNGNLIPSISYGGTGSSSSQAGIIIQDPYNCKKYYLFTLNQRQGSGIGNGGGNNTANKQLNYFIIDMNVMPYGDVVTPTTPLANSSCSESITTALHSNGIDVWVITHEIDNDVFNAYLISNNGISIMQSSSTGNIPYDTDSQIGMLRANHNGNKIASTHTFVNGGILFLYDFDQSTGIVSNEVDIYENYGIYGIEFSNNDQFLYATDIHHQNGDPDYGIYQFQMSTLLPPPFLTTPTNIYPLIDPITNNIMPNGSVGALQMSSSNSIIVAINNTQHLGLIPFPDVINCGFIDNALNLSPSSCRLGLPNFPPHLIQSGYTSNLSTYDLGNDITTCFPGVMNLNAGDFASFNWTQPTGNNYTTTNQTMLASISGTYCCTVSDLGGCTSTDCIYVTFATSPTLAFTYPSQICPGDEINLGVTGGNNCTFIWSTSETTNSILVTPTASQYSYSVTATNTNGCSATEFIDIEFSENCLSKYCMYLDKPGDLDPGTAIAQTDDEGFILTGSMHEIGSGGDRDMYVCKFNNNMLTNPIPAFAERLGDENKPEDSYSVLVRSDGYYICGSSTTQNGPQTVTSLYVAKFDLVGNKIWSNVYLHSPNNYTEVGRKIISVGANNDGDLLITGFSNVKNTNTNQNFDIFAIRLRSTDGFFINNNYYDFQNENEFAFDVIRLESDKDLTEFIIVGEQFKNVLNRNIVAIKINSGLVLGANIIIDNFGKHECAYSVTQKKEKIYLAGYTNYSNYINDGTTNFYIVELNPDLTYSNNVILKYSGPQANKLESFYRIRPSQISDELIVCGASSEINGTVTNGNIMKIDPGLNFQVNNTVVTDNNITSESYVDFFEDEQGYITLTGTYGLNGTDGDVYISKVDPELLGCCQNIYKLDRDNSHYEKSGIKDKKFLYPHISPSGDTIPWYDDRFICEEGYHFRIFDPIQTNIPTHSSLSISPNPTNGNISIKLTENDSEIKKVVISDLSGRILKVIEPQSSSIEMSINLDEYTDGCYIIQVTDSGNNNYNSKLILNR